MQTICPYCRAKCQVPDQLLGKQVSCPNTACRKAFFVSATAGGVPAMASAGAAAPGAHPPAPHAPQATGGHAPSYDGQAAAHYPTVPPAQPPQVPWQMPAPGAAESFLGDLFLGREKQFEFPLLPGEQPLDEIVLELRMLSIIRRGMTRVVLTNKRVLYTTTRMFTPLYWVLVALFPPLLFYYVFRVAKNRSVAVPLRSIDSVEKAYRPNIGLFVLVLFLCGLMVMMLRWLVVPLLGTTLAEVALYPVSAVLAVAQLVLLLTSRLVGIIVRSDNNHFAVLYSPSNQRVSERRFDEFIERAYEALHQEAHTGI